MRPGLYAALGASAYLYLCLAVWAPHVAASARMEPATFPPRREGGAL